MTITITHSIMQPKESGSVFGKVGSFEKGYAFNALVIDNMEDPWTKMTAEENWSVSATSEMTGILRPDILMGSCWSRNFRNLLFSVLVVIPDAITHTMYIRRASGRSGKLMTNRLRRSGKPSRLSLRSHGSRLH